MQMPAVAPWDLKQKHSAVLEFFIVVPKGISVEQATDATYWRNAWKVLDGKTYSTVDLIADDGAWEATVRLLHIDEKTVRFRTIRYWEPDKKVGRKPTMPDGYRVEHMPGVGWRAVAPDGTVITMREPQEDDAIRAALNHSRSRTAA